MTDSSHDKKTPESIVKTLRIIILALAGGLISAAIIIAAASATDDSVREETPQQPFFTYVAFALFAGAIVGSFLVPKLAVATEIRGLAKTKNNESDASMEERVLDLFVTRTIIGAAFIEPAGLFASMAFMFERQVIVLFIVPLAIIAILLHFPSVEGVENWISRANQRIDEQRMLNP